MFFAEYFSIFRGCSWYIPVPPYTDTTRKLYYLLGIGLFKEKQSKLSAVNEEYYEIESRILRKRAADDCCILDRGITYRLMYFNKNAAALHNFRFSGGVFNRRKIQREMNEHFKTANGNC